MTAACRLHDLAGSCERARFSPFRTREERLGMTIEALRAARASNLPALPASQRPLDATLTAQAFLCGTAPAQPESNHG